MEGNTDIVRLIVGGERSFDVPRVILTQIPDSMLAGMFSGCLLYTSPSPRD